MLFPGSLLPSSSTADTVEMWFKTSSTNGILMGSEYSLGPSQPTAWDPMLYVDSSGYLQAELWYDGALNTIISTAPVDDGHWHEAVVTVTTGGTEKLLVDGNAEATGTLKLFSITGLRDDWCGIEPRGSERQQRLGNVQRADRRRLDLPDGSIAGHCRRSIRGCGREHPDEHSNPGDHRHPRHRRRAYRK